MTKKLKNPNWFKRLEKRIEEIEKMKETFENNSELLEKPWGEKHIEPWKEIVIKDPEYSDFRFYECKVTYAIVFPQLEIDYAGKERFIAEGRGIELQIRQKIKPLDYWRTEWKIEIEPEVRKKDCVSVNYPPQLLGKEAIVKDIKETLELLNPLRYLNEVILREDKSRFYTR